MSLFVQRNQSQRFSDAAQQKLVDSVGHYIRLAKQGGSMLPITESTFQMLKDGLAMPFNVFGTKQKKRLLKWYNELIAIIGEDPEKAISSDVTSEPSITWNVMDINEDGYLSLVQVDSGETNDSFQVKKYSAEFNRIKKALENNEVIVATSGDEIKEIMIDNE
ncbi:hypothetical protein PsorP6_003422 [Peronosclerospora sorghi]|uniref:Uncharacterized protein n=1 Tax=Peronosclerospora sorghi TaxID=230839 RepID=A0ACC0VKM3_9STRA|nr:hypothetical protein PsorP6_003422 [Peronosclerospora sorghi]